MTVSRLSGLLGVEFCCSLSCFAITCFQTVADSDMEYPDVTSLVGSTMCAR
jgi:hypothetical protein